MPYSLLPQVSLSILYLLKYLLFRGLLSILAFHETARVALDYFQMKLFSFLLVLFTTLNKVIKASLNSALVLVGVVEHRGAFF